MQVRCPQHDIPLEIEERAIDILDLSYPSVVGKCPLCQYRYINRMVFPSCSTFKVLDQTYQYLGRLHDLYPPKEPVPSQKKAQAAERKAKNREAGIKEMRERILNNEYKEYHIKKVHFVAAIPEGCFIDGDELLDVQRVSFEIYGKRVKGRAHCCIRCNSAYLLQSQQAEIQKLVGEIPVEKKPRTKPTKKPKLPAFTISHILNQVPILETSKSLCPFCGQVFEGLVGVKYHVTDTNGQFVKRHTNLQGCRHCKAVFADKQQIQSIRAGNYKKKVFTISPLSYQNANAMMEATKMTPQQEDASKLPLPFEDQANGIENISRESKVVQVYAHKCHCQKCENKYKRMTTVNRTAVVDTLDGSSANINVMFCKGCGQYFVSIVTLEQYKTIYGGILMECKVSHDFSPTQYSWFDFAPDSILSRCGYTVKEGVSRDYRQAILRYILETGKATKYEIIEKINSFISLREDQLKYEGACQRWREDIKFVNEYMLHRQKKVYGLEFKTAKKH